MQSKRESMFEAVMGVFIGFVVAMGTQIAIFPYFGINITIVENLKMSLIFTVISIVRGYFVRRWFNARQAKIRAKEAACQL